MFKHDNLNIYYTLWSLNLIPLLQIPTNDKAQFKNGANFISHFHVRPPMYPLRVYSRIQSHITDHHKTRAWSQKHFCFTSPWVAMNRNTSFQQPGGFVSMTTAAEIQVYFFQTLNRSCMKNNWIARKYLIFYFACSFPQFLHLNYLLLSCNIHLNLNYLLNLWKSNSITC